MLPVTDAAVASAYAEAVVVVIRHGRTSRTQVANAASTLENVDARVVGSVLNMKKSSRGERRRYGHHGYYFGQSGYGPPRTAKRPAPKVPVEQPSPEQVNGRTTVQAGPVGESEDTIAVVPKSGKDGRATGHPEVVDPEVVDALIPSERVVRRPARRRRHR